MQKQIEQLIQKCKADYTKFAMAGDRGMPEPDSYFGKTKKIPDAITNVNIPNIGQSTLKMTDDSGKSTEQLIKELQERAFKSQYEFKKKELEMETDLSPEEIDRIARKNAGRSGRNMAEGGVVSFAPYLR